MHAIISSTRKLSSAKSAVHAASARKHAAPVPSVRTARRHAVSDSGPILLQGKLTQYAPGLVPPENLPYRGMGPFQPCAVATRNGEDRLLGPEEGVMQFDYDGGPIGGLLTGEYADRPTKYIGLFTDSCLKLVHETRPQDNACGMATHSNLGREGVGVELWMLQDGTPIINFCSSRFPLQFPQEWDPKNKVWKPAPEGSPQRREQDARQRAVALTLARMQKRDVVMVQLGDRWGEYRTIRVPYPRYLAAPCLESRDL